MAEDDSKRPRKKILLMGRSGAGKTSMRSIIFSNYIAHDTYKLGATSDIEHSHVRFLGNLVLNLWDCGGQDAYVQTYFTTRKHKIFRNTHVLVYLFDVKSPEPENDLDQYKKCFENLLKYSPEAEIFCLFHKIDLITTQEEKEQIFNDKKALVKSISDTHSVNCYMSSIWDESLYSAWSQIVYCLIPNIVNFENNLLKLSNTICAYEAIIFEKATFLIIAQNPRTPSSDPRHFEKVSHLIKKLKFNCNKLRSDVYRTVFNWDKLTVVIQEFTVNSYIMLVYPGDIIPFALCQYNIDCAREYFKILERESTFGHSVIDL